MQISMNACPVHTTATETPRATTLREDSSVYATADIQETERIAPVRRNPFKCEIYIEK